MINEKGVELEGIVPLPVFTPANGHIPLQIVHKVSQKVFGLHKMNETVGSFVELQKKSADTTKKDHHQMWIRTEPEGNGTERFMLRNEKSKLHLYADWHGYFTNGHITITHEVLDCKLFQNY